MSMQNITRGQLSKVSDDSVIKNNTWNSIQNDAYTANVYLIKYEGELTYEFLRIIIVIINITWSLQQVHSLYESVMNVEFE